MPKAAGGRDSAAHLAVKLSLGHVGAQAISRHVVLAYAQNQSIEYLGRRLHDYWQRNGMTEQQMLAAAETEYPELEQRGLVFDRQLTADMMKVGGADYAYLGAMLFRQTLAAHKLVADLDGTPMFFSKENDSNGHLAHNTNLSLKAIEALGAFREIANGVGDAKLAEHYKRLVKPLPAEWIKMAQDGDHFRLAFDQPDTWNQKYNLVWDQVLDLHLFPKSVAEAEWAFYSKQMKVYGLPLDSRRTYTKLDWEVWTAALAHDPAQSQDLLHRLVVWMDNTPSRVPTTDWYDTTSGKEQAFQARAAVGGIFIKALLDSSVAAHHKLQH